jgi:regulatory protein
LSMREHTRTELERKLMRPTKTGPVDRAEVTRVLDELALRDMQSDSRAARSYVSAKGRKLGKRRIGMELRQRGLSVEDVSTALASHNDEETCALVWQKKFGTVASDIKQKQKQFRFLAARGFGMDTIRKVMGNSGLTLDETLDF